MDKNNVRNIDIDDDEVVAELVAPTNILRMGTPDDDAPAIFIKQGVYNQIEKFSTDNLKREVGGALVGKSGTIGSKPAVIIDNFIEAKHTDSTKSTLTFTPETWAYLYGEREKRFPQSKIVGWHRTHPGDGSSLSNYDIYIEENFFNSEYDVTYITDPISGQRAFYGKKKGRTVKMKGFTMYDDNGKTITAGRTQAPQQQRKPIPQPPKKKKSHLPHIVSIALILLLLIANIVASVSTNIKLDKLISTTEKNNSQALNAEIIENIVEAVGEAKTNENNEEFETNTELPQNGTPIVVPEKDTTPETAFNNENDIATTPEQTGNNEEETPRDATVPEQTPPLMNNTEENKPEQGYVDENGIEYFDYTVQPGEFISLICDRFGINYDEYLDDIVRESGIANPDSIEIGQIIKLPKLN